MTATMGPRMELMAAAAVPARLVQFDVPSIHNLQMLAAKEQDMVG